jgi:hypothetical protein
MAKPTALAKLTERLEVIHGDLVSEEVEHDVLQSTADLEKTCPQMRKWFFP